MGRISPEEWLPRGIEDLEPQAWRALRESNSSCVVAGPGAGKTEFLAQRAVYLLETGLCPVPQRILAISFKTDAAANLAKRVQQRCPPELAQRFVSVTFDAFTKSLLDRFTSTIPESWRPTRPYDLAFLSRRQIEGFLEEQRIQAVALWQPEIAALSVQDFEARHVGSQRLQVNRLEPASAIEWVLDGWWDRQLRGQERSALSFVSINRLAELLLRANPSIRRALQATYPFIFVDEFQDTTYAQYDFLLSAFGNGRTIVTAVGDDKQRIMTWAGARIDTFERLQEDFGATRIPLLFNFRSSPGLVRIQQVVARALDPNADESVSRAAQLVADDVAQVWISRTLAAEAQHLSQWLAADMAERERTPRDYAILVRQKADQYEAELSESLAQAGLRLRNETHTLGRTTLQDLLADDACQVAVALLRLGAQRRAPDSWSLASAALQSLRAADPDDEITCHKVEAELTAFLRELRAFMSTTPPDPISAQVAVQRIFAFLDPASLSRTYLQYGTGDLLSIIMEAFELHLAASAEDAVSWVDCVGTFEGTSQIPLMTVHKSKGLEYDTILFVGLDDRAWWSYSPGNPEGLATFFVALSRAKQRAIFAFCQNRGARRRVADLYQLLTDAGVPEIDIDAE